MQSELTKSLKAKLNDFVNALKAKSVINGRKLFKTSINRHRLINLKS